MMNDMQKEEMPTENLAEEHALESNSEEETTPTEQPNEPLSEVDQLKLELAESKDRFLRLYAEFENFRKRTSKEKIELIQNAGEGVLKELLPVVDDFERAQKSMESSDDITALKEGVELVYSKLLKVLSQKGVKAMEAKDQPFDAELHECITQFPAGDEKKGLVIDEVEKGYFLNDKVIRYAKVVVGQ